MADYKLVGKNFTPPDMVAKVTGAAKYAEDFRAEGMLHAKLMLSPLPHARVRSIDTSAAMKIKGVVAIITPDDVPQFPPPVDPILYKEPVFAGAPILAVAAESEEIAAAAIEAIKVDFEQLKHVVDPLDSLYPGGINAFSGGNVANVQLPLQTVKWTAKDFQSFDQGKMPMGKAAEEWAYGDLDAGFKKAKVVIERSFLTAGTSHHSMEPRSNMSYWQNGKCYVHGSMQSQSFVVPNIARYLGIKPQEVVFIAEYCGGGFGSKGTGYPLIAVSGLLSKKANGRPVMLRISREEESLLGSGRAGFQGMAKIGFAENGRITAFDVFVVQDNGPNMGFWDFRNCGHSIQICFQPEAMRWRGTAVLTNTSPRGPQRGPGENQTAMAIEPMIDEGARELGLDRLAIRRINAPDNDGFDGHNAKGKLTSAFLKDALVKGGDVFKWEEKKKLSGKRNGNKVIGVGIASAFHAGGSNGFDGIVRILPDGKLYVHSGVGNLGTFSCAATSRVAAEVLGYNWDNVVIVRGRTDKHLPWMIGQFGSNTAYTASRSNYVAAMDAKDKLLEIASQQLGGASGDYDLKNERVVHKTDASKSIGFADAAKRAMELGGKFAGKELPADINPLTKASVEALAGTGLIGVAKDKLPKRGMVPALCAGFCMVELDTETGEFEIKEYLGVADCGTVLHPAGLQSQMHGGAMMGFGLATTERIVYDHQLGLPANVQFDQSKPPTYLDMPKSFHWAAVEQPDRDNPVGVKGIGEPIQGAAAGALINAISDALGGHYFHRTPVVRDMIINALAKRPQSYRALQANTM
ncbi:MAG: xanthine dehydrogenase family protein molybdopterin-binding subunit [Betaproteobacteria bacterium]|nr:xanthine dehydrogenase family protein molybdopterin-binding subunit [Pseudolabrys sp.]MSQ73951.1 xanthine dehydrogenase family protein molybdopterin-binding subunit [Betaproteobacteria bacterium]